ncbi:hypothetical protein [Streptomyces sp. NPDC052092]|uniref:hypothetical protein n=1 Tax=Streptomyces sp. NPDC052092 TaxID=3365685 RepID=UPI0037D6E642
MARHLGRREHISDTVQAIAGLLSHQQTGDGLGTTDVNAEPHRDSRHLTAYRA